MFRGARCLFHRPDDPRSSPWDQANLAPEPSRPPSTARRRRRIREGHCQGSNRFSMHCLILKCVSSQSRALQIPNAEDLLPGPVQLVHRTNPSPGSFGFSGINADCCQCAHEVTLQSPSTTQYMVPKHSMGEQCRKKGCINSKPAD
jgi:hypothetical protein